MSVFEKLHQEGVTFIGGNPAGVQFGFGGRKKTIFETYVQIRPGKFDIDLIGAFTYLGGGTGTLMRHIEKVGRFSSIAGGVISGMVEHPTDYLSTHPAFYGEWKGWPEVDAYHQQNANMVKAAKDEYLRRQVADKGKIVIGNDVWIGEGAFIARGVKIGDGAVISSKSVVLKDVPPYSIVAGVPGRAMKLRFDKEIVARLCNLNWWAYGTSATAGVDCTNIEAAIDKIAQNIDTGVARIHLPKTIMLDENNKVSEVPSVDAFRKLYSGQNIKTTMNVGEISIPLNVGDDHELMYYATSEGGDLPVDIEIAKKLIQPGDTVIDAGANIGFFAAHAVDAGAGRVIAFEPHPDNFSRIKDLSGRIDAMDCALSGTDGELPLIISTSHNQGHTLNSEMKSVFSKVYEGEETVSVPTKALDSLNVDGAEFVKVDIEGGELNFLSGASKTLKNSKTRHLLVEIYDHNFVAATKGFLEIFPSAFRVSRKNGKVVLAEVKKGATKPPEGDMPPMYIFSKDDVKKALK